MFRKELRVNNQYSLEYLFNGDVSLIVKRLCLVGDGRVASFGVEFITIKNNINIINFYMYNTIGNVDR